MGRRVDEYMLVCSNCHEMVHPDYAWQCPLCERVLCRSCFSPDYWDVKRCDGCGRIVCADHVEYVDGYDYCEMCRYEMELSDENHQQAGLA